MSTLAVKYDFKMEQGSLFQFRVNWVDHDLSGYDAIMQIRKTVDSGVVIAELTSASEITLDALGNIDIEIPATDTAEYDFDTAVYDLEIYPTGHPENAIKIIRGTITLIKEVTRS